MRKRTLSTFVLLSLCVGHLSAQDVDLSAQRFELLGISPIPQSSSSHTALGINPTPQQMNIDSTRFLSVVHGFRLIDKQHRFSDHLSFLKSSKDGIRLTIDFQDKKNRRNLLKNIPGAYKLIINEKGVSISGFDASGAFYGLQTLRQILDSPLGKQGKLPYLVINDYPDLPNRGVVEGFYGTPWSHRVRLYLIDFYGRQKMNTYVYGPKDDPYHSSPNWRNPYPEKEAAQIRELIEACRRNFVNFVWAIHPGQDIKWDEEDYQNLINKFNRMYDLGVRSFAIFFDDISGDGTNPERQTALLNRLTEDFVSVKGDVTPLTVCPTDYTRAWANPTPQGSLAIYGKTLHPSVNVFWTGDAVCSDVTKSTLEWVDSRIKRPAYFWWNFPVTDYCRNIVMQGPAYGFDNSLTSDDLCGVLSNPMEHGEASKIALFGVADYNWNIAAYQPMDNWERALKAIAPFKSDAYKTFAIHSGDTGNGYRRDESWNVNVFRLSSWERVSQEAQQLKKEFQKIQRVPDELNGMQNQALYEELKPWLTEFGKLGKRGEKAIELMELYKNPSHNPADFWTQYISNLMSREARQSYDAHKSGTLLLQPFYESAMEDLGHAFLSDLLEREPIHPKGMSSFANAGGRLPLLMLDHDSTTYYTSAISQKGGDWIGLDLGELTMVDHVEILQGRRQGDSDYFDHAALEYSKDGMTWGTLMNNIQKQYSIRWVGKPVEARFVRIKRLDSERRNHAAIRQFTVNPLTPRRMGFTISAADTLLAMRAFDQRLDTSYPLDASPLTFDVSRLSQQLILLMDRPTHVVVTQTDAKGKTLYRQPTDGAYIPVTLVPGASHIQLTGTGNLVEIIHQKDKNGLTQERK